MKDVSQELDPDTHKQMEKFRKVCLSRLLSLSVNVSSLGSLKGRKIVENVDQCFPNSKTTSSNVLFCQQPKDNQLTAILPGKQ